MLLHGCPQHWWQWHALAPVIAARGYRVICPDLRGAGWTVADDPRIEPETRLRDLLALFDVLHIERAHLVAHDMGVFTAMQLTYDQPRRRARRAGAAARHRRWCDGLLWPGPGAPAGTAEAGVPHAGTAALPVEAALGAPPPQALARMPDAVKTMLDKTGVTPDMIRDIRLATVARMHRAGVQFVAGRDSGIAPHLAHGTLRDSVAFLAEAGASTAQAVATATSRAAHACGIGDTKGQLPPRL